MSLLNSSWRTYHLILYPSYTLVFFGHTRVSSPPCFPFTHEPANHNQCVVGVGLPVADRRRLGQHTFSGAAIGRAWGHAPHTHTFLKKWQALLVFLESSLRILADSSPTPHRPTFPSHIHTRTNTKTHTLLLGPL